LPERKIKTKTKAKTAHVAETTSQESCAIKLKRSRIPRSTLLSYDVSTLGAMNCCVASYTLKKANTGTWTGVCRMDFGDPGREKGACDLEVDTIYLSKREFSNLWRLRASVSFFCVSSPPPPRSSLNKLGAVKNLTDIRVAKKADRSRYWFPHCLLRVLVSSLHDG